MKPWVAAYYPLDLIEDERTKTLFCLLFDKVICHFPYAHTGCGGGAGWSGFYAGDPLVEEGVLELYEEPLLGEIEGEFSDGYPWGTDEEFKIYHDLNSAGMALKYCAKADAIPATDRVGCPVPVSILSQFDPKRAADIQAAALAIQSVTMAIPAFATLNSEQILEAREVLKDQFAPFRAAMYALAPKVRSGLESNADIGDISREAEYIVQTDIAPRLDDLKRRLEQEQGAFWRRLLQRVGSALPGIALKWMATGGTAAAVDMAKLAGGIGNQAIENEQLVTQLLNNGGLGYLINCQDTVTKAANGAVDSTR